MGLMEKIFGDLNEKEIKKISKIVDQVEALDEDMQKLSDEELQAMTPKLKERLANGETLDDILPEAFAVCREGAVRSLGMKHFRVQLIGGVVLHQGRISEMKTGEGKTLVATLAAYLNALEGKGVHVITVNDYLAKRDAEWMGKLYSFLGLSVGCVIHGISGEERKAAYMADITYGTNNEFGFDYLRDNMVIYQEELMQRDLNFAIIDEVDSILVDEARTPLIISGKGAKSTDLYKTADRFVTTLTKETDFTVEEKDQQVALTDEGVAKAEAFFKVDNYGDPENMEINHHVLQALKARNLMERDVDYIVKDGEIIIVDEFTGRLMFGRRFSNGLHQAIEAKERVAVRSESKTLATITLQNYFRMYNKLAGMTGTAKTEEEEFRDIYNMDVVVIPTNREIARKDLDDSVYQTERGKVKAIANRVAQVHETGQPVLVGTISIEKSEMISDMLKKRGVKHNVLNAKQHDKEAEIVAEAGRLGMVTIATNMAGRGTDIILGGNPEFEAKREMKKQGYSDEEISFASSFIKSDDPALNEAREKFNQLHQQFKEERKEEQQKVVELGGLCIIGTERHESRRIDNQLRGRSGRQGDPGQTQFFISLEDELLRLFGGERMQKLVDRMGLEEDEAIEAGMLSRAIEGAQKKVEGKNFGIRKYVLQYDNVMNKQREIIYEERRKVLFGEDLREYIINMMKTIVNAIIDPIVVDSKFPEEWDFETMNKNLRKITANYRGKSSHTAEELRDMTEESLRESVIAEFEKLYELKEAEIGAEQMREVERMILLRVVDNLWMDHIDAMDQLKSGIGLRALGQQDPAAAYAKEGFDMFEQMISAIQEDTVKYCYNVTVETKTERRAIMEAEKATKSDFVEDDTVRAMQGEGQLPEGAQVPERENKPETYRRDQPKVGRNDPCPCGSGKKYKNCCGRS
ncbi:preprotein translocase subunit SecA [Anaerotruncus sp. 80]|uniref:Protein translocase subunit SecA n=1 Tax=Anaerotruncus colihominis TaxID=169435 RepID=A0A845QJQ1_9FIRM|nr:MULTISPECIES: preprotein translocase subunit SecA [Anaerotruncus]NBH61321.1 preprotein translocase subunit SecA [Anaerotruncus colihominis]NCF01976.1 preprotein translocase subunit SecA [Anaerotruncus sp. 80]